MDFERPKSGGEPMLPGGFRAAVARELLAHDLTPKAWHAAGVDCVTAAGESRYLGLANLYRRAKSAGREEWPAMVRHFLGVLATSTSAENAPPDSLDAVRGRVRVRLGVPFALAEPANPWQRLLAGTPLAVNLVIDSDEYMTYVTQGMVEASGESADDWLAVGIANLRDATPDDWLGTFHEETGMLGGHAGDSYDAARALVLEEIGEPSPAGWLVAIPARDWLFALPVTRASLPGLPLLKVLTQKSYAEDAYPICDEVFWVRGGVWERLPVTLTDERADVSPSDAFLAALEELNAIEEGDLGEVGGEA